MIRRMCAITVALVFAVSGCGEKDPNKDLKPIDPNTPPPKIATEGAGGGAGGPAKQPNDGAPKVIQ